MPMLRFKTLKFIIEFINELTQYQAENKMTSYNCSVCIAPSIFRRSNKNQKNKVIIVDENYKSYYSVMVDMIDHCSEIFGESDIGQ